MGEMVERATRALCRAMVEDENGWQFLEGETRAVIEALREPTQEMRNRIWDLLERNAMAGNLQAGHIRGNGFPDALLNLIVNEALKS